MRYLSIPCVSLVAFFPCISALTITSPAPGSTIDVLEPLVISWTSDSSDPSTVDLRIDNANSNLLSTDVTLATGVSTSSGSYTVPPNTIQDFGTDFQIEILSDGTTLAESTGLVLIATSTQVSTNANGQLTTVSATSAEAASTAAQTESAAATTNPSGDPATTNSEPNITLSGTVTGGEGSATAPGATRTASSFVTSASSTTSSRSQASAAATSASSTSTANGQRRLGSEYVLSAAGVLAGVVALLA